jgi:hypothetical protein
MNNLIISIILSTAILAFNQLSAKNIAVSENSVEVTDPILSLTSNISPTPWPKSIRDIDSKVGIVDVTEKKLICFRAKNANLKIHTPVSIIASPYEFPQKVLTATVAKKLKKSCVRDDSDIGEDTPQANSYYSLILKNKNFDKSQIGIGIGVINPVKPVRIQKGLALVDLNNDRKSEFFRVCASNEGLHLTVWTGKPLVGKRIWHRYYYLQYETEADCQKKDWIGTED